MKNLKRLLSVIICFSMILSMQVFALEFPDVTADNKNATAIDVLSSLGIIKGYENGQFMPDKGVTRAELTSLLMRLLNLSITGTSVTESGFDDVANDHWAVYDIKTASSMGIIKGFGDGTFGPEASVTFEQAVKMVVAMLGYESEAINKGGWPDGYVSQGRDLGLLKNAEMVQTDPAPRKIIAQILYNALTVDLMAEKSLGSENTSYYIKKGQNVMTEYMKISKVEGMLTANSTTRLDNSENNVTDKQVEITVDGVPTKYAIGNFENAKDLLGMSVVAYVKEDETSYNPVIQHIMLKSKIQELVISANGIQKFNNPQSITVEEKDTGKTKVYNIAENAVFIYNGKYIDKTYLFNNNLAKPTIGSVKLVDSGLGYNYVAIENYENFYVKSVDATAFKIYIDTTIGNVDPSDSEIYVPVEEKYGYDISIKKNGKDVSLSTIKKGNIISVKRNKTSVQSGVQNIEILVSDTKKSGKITEEADEYVVIDSKQYPVSPSIKGTELESKVTYNQNGTFYIDAFGAIAYVEVTAGGTYKYGYILRYGYKDSEGVSNIRLYDYTAKKDVLYDFHTKVEINGNTVSDHSKIEEIITTSAEKLKVSSAGIDKLYGQPVKYILNGSGKIIDFITVGYAEDKSMNTVKYVAAAAFNSTNKYFDVDGSKIKVDSKTVFMEIPKMASDADGKVVKADDVIRRDTSFFKNLYKYEIHMIGTTETGSIAVVLAYEANVDKDVHYSSPIYIVKEIKDVYENEENKTKLTLINFQTGAETTATCIDKSNIARVEIGDVIRFGKDNDGEINEKVYIYMDVSEVKQRNMATDGYGKTDYANYPYRKVVHNNTYGSSSYYTKNLNALDNYYAYILGVPYTITDNTIQLTDKLPSEFDNPETEAKESPAKENTLLVTATASTYFHTINADGEITSVKGSTADNNVVGTIYSYEDQPDTFNFIYIYMVDEVLKAVYIVK